MRESDPEFQLRQLRGVLDRVVQEIDRCAEDDPTANRLREILDQEAWAVKTTWERRQARLREQGGPGHV